MDEQEQIEQGDEQHSQEVEQEVEQTTGETPEASDAPETEGEGEVVISFGDEQPAEEQAEQASAPAWVKELRKSDREKARKIRELEAKLAEKAQPAAEELGKEPDLGDEDIDYDTNLFKQRWQEWNQLKQAHDAKQAAEKAADESQQKAWQTTLDNYGTAKAALKLDDFDDAEDAAKEALGATRAGIVLAGASKPAELIYALGKNPAKLKELSAITDPVKFAWAAAQLETKLSVTPRKAPPPAEKPIRGNSTAVGVADKTLERLEAAAEQSGDYSKVFAYKREQRRKAEA